MVAPSCNPCFQESEAGGSLQTGRQFDQYSEFQAPLGLAMTLELTSKQQSKAKQLTGKQHKSKSNLCILQGIIEISDHFWFKCPYSVKVLQFAQLDM